MCFFGHNFGLIQPDGFQYCSGCGKARKPSIPHPCVNGHLWKDDKTDTYIRTTYGPRGTSQEETLRQTFQTCSTCGGKRNVWG